jgi:hypothetical protein
MCWTFAEECTGDSTQRGCSVNGYNWCCRSYETCTNIPGQINICWPPWGNPNENRSAPDALIFNQANYPILPALSTTRTADSTAAATSAAGSTTTGPAASGATTITGASTPSDPPLSLGAIVGIGIGCGVAGVVLAAGATLLIFRRRRRRGVQVPPPGPAQQYDRSDGMTPQRLELKGDDNTVEIDTGRDRGAWVSELPAGRYA